MSKLSTRGFVGFGFPGLWIAIAVIVILFIFFAAFWWFGGGFYGPYY
ncbi:hypothetical protein [Salinithrix halophila]|uniref:Sporulation protein YjcZ n=1 Tax=Salinithrix halophila TaxID=1485204 RepID=A0ABV8JBN2_9BACL